MGSATNAAAFARVLGTRGTQQASTQVAAVRTQLDSGQASAALRTAWQSVTGQEPSDGTLRILKAQWAHETGNGASMFNYNFGGIKGTGPSGLSVAQRTHEGFGANERAIVDHFRAYQSADEGATDYVRLLTTRFPEAVNAAKNGDPAGFVHGLKARGYFTGDEGAYTRSVVALSGVALPSGASAPPPVLSPQRVGAAKDAELAFAQPSAPLVDGLSLADEISRAALRIAAATRPESERG